ncbi:AAA family ATPase [Nonomuraea spiralis]|uniref:caspase, EACC1-associated type n=1 Tax=Nonomuraea spiralis TaxID=46182 RepID=UPI0037A4C459
MAQDLPDGGGSRSGLGRARVLLVGTATHLPGSRLRDEQAVADTLIAFKHALVDQCGVRRDALDVCLDPQTPGEFGHALQTVTEGADRSDVLLVCYAGHGMVSSSDGQLYLATRESGGDGRLEHTAWPYANLRRYVLESRAQVKIVILDCCFSGRAVSALAADQDEIANVAEIAGTYVLTSAGRDEYALVLPGGQRTAFLGTLVDLLNHGDPEADRTITVAAAYRHLARMLPAKGCARPVGRGLSLAGDLVLALNRAWRSKGADAPPRPAGTERRQCPYPGLAAFSAADSSLFFGREQLTGKLVKKIAERYDEPAPVLVMGNSGSGKTSLLHAGVLPAIGHGDLEIAGSSTWPRLAFTPTARPLAALAANITPLIHRDPAELEELIRARPEALQEALSRTPPGHRIVLVVDQFEELFTQCSDEAERQAFIRALHSTWSGHGGEPTTLVVLGVRADFFGRCADHGELTQAISRHTMVVGPMKPQEVRDAIERPAERVELSLEAGLTEVLLTDLGVRRGGDETQPAYEAGRLPLLAHALRAVWQRRDGDVLTVAAYREIDGIGGALATSADTVLAGLDEKGRSTARDLLLRLVRVGEGTDDTRQRASPGELIDDAPEPDAARKVLHTLAADDARLITLDGDTVQITHEALLHSWPTLRSWIEADRADLRLRHRLASEARAWERSGRKAGDLAKATSLAILRDWAIEPEGLRTLDGGTREFAEASIRRARRRRTGAFAIFSVFLLLFAVTVVQWRTADERNRIATTRKLTAEAEVRRDNDPIGALRANLAAYGLAGADGPVHGEARANLTAAILGDSLPLPFPAHRGPVNAVAFTPDGGTLATGGSDSAVILWDIRDPVMPGKAAVLTGHEGPVTSAEFDARGSLLVTGDAKGRVVLWNTADPRHPRQAAVLKNLGAVNTVALSPRGAVLATAGQNAKAALWDVTDPGKPLRLATISGHDKPISSIAFSPDGRLLATASDDATVKLWQVSTPTRPHRVATIKKELFLPKHVAFHPDGNDLAIAGGRGVFLPVGSSPLVTLWDIRDNRRPQLISESAAHQGTVDRLAFNPSGTRMVTASSGDAAVILWEWREQKAVLQHSSAVTALRFNPDGRLLAIGGEDGTMRLRIVTNPAAPRMLFDVSGTGPAALHPNGSILAMAEMETVKLWDLRQDSTPKQISSIRIGARVGQLTFSSDGATLVVVTAWDAIRIEVWDIRIPASPRRVAVAPVNMPEESSSVVFHPGRKMLAVTGKDGAVSFWDLRDPARAARLSALSSGAKGTSGTPTFDEHGDFLAVVNDDRPPSLWDVRDPRAPRRVTWDGAPPASVVAFGGDGSRRLLATGNGNTVTLWDLTTQPAPSRIAVLTTVKNVHWLTFNPSGDLLITGSSENRHISHWGPRPTGEDLWGRADAAEFWIITDPAAPRRLPAMTDEVPLYPPYTFSADERRLLTGYGSGPGDVALWSTAELQDVLVHPRERGCTVAGRGLTQEEWTHYAPGIPYQEDCPPAR